MNDSFISLDCETNGLYGQVYAVAMQVYRKGILVDSICLSCSINQELDGWLLDNPHLIEVDGSVKTTYSDMMEKLQISMQITLVEIMRVRSNSNGVT